MIRLSALFFLLAAPAMAQTLGLPDGCTAYLTVQGTQCNVTHYITCAGDPPGQQYAVDMYADGGDYINVLDAEAQWVMSVDGPAGTTDRLGLDPIDPSLISELIDTGKDSYDFTTVADDGTVTRFVGKEALTGQTVMIDGVSLLETRNEIRAVDASGAELWRNSGTEYVNPDWHIYLAGQTDWVVPTDAYSTDGTPVDFVFPGDPGFLTTAAAFGCVD